jgi:membrane protease subunit HflK
MRSPYDGETVVRFPDLSRFRERFRRFPWGPLLVVVVGVILLTGAVYQIEPEEVGVVLRFGRYVRTEGSGLHFKVPFGVEQVIKVPVERQLKEEFGFRTVEPGDRTQYTTEGLDDESLMLTGDLNIADVEWVVQYRIVDAHKFLFRVRSVRETFRAMTEAVIREVVGDRTVHEVLTIGRQEIASQVEVSLQELCNQYETGLKVEQVVLQNVYPPEPVKPSFNEVNQSQQEREQKINAAQSAYNQVIPRASGEAEQTVSQAEGYALDRVNRARGDAARFLSLYEEYRKAPEVTRKRIYLETMADVLNRSPRKWVVDDSLKGLVPLLQIQSTPAPAGSPPAGGSP